VGSENDPKDPVDPGLGQFGYAVLDRRVGVLGTESDDELSRGQVLQGRGQADDLGAGALGQW
jgi:hypothetical protein